MIRGAGGATRTLLDTAGITLDDARAAVTDSGGPREPLVEPAEIPFQPATKALFTAAGGEADRLGHATIATSHIVPALVGGQDVAASFLPGRGVTLEAARAAAAAGGGQD